MVAAVVAIPSDWQVPPHPLALADATRLPCRSKVAPFRCSPLRSLSADCGRSGLLSASHGEAARPAWRRNATSKALDARNRARGPEREDGYRGAPPNPCHGAWRSLIDCSAHRDMIGRRNATAHDRYTHAHWEATCRRRPAQWHTPLEHRHHRLDRLVSRRAVDLPRWDPPRPHWLV